MRTSTTFTLLLAGLLPSLASAADGACEGPSGSPDPVPALVRAVEGMGDVVPPGYSRHRFRIPVEVGSALIRQRGELLGTIDLEDETGHDRQIRNVRIEMVLEADPALRLRGHFLRSAEAGDTSDLDPYEGWREPSRGYATNRADGVDLYTESKVVVDDAARETVLEGGLGRRSDGSRYSMTHRLGLAVYCSRDLAECQLGAVTPGVFFLGNGFEASPDVKVRSDASFGLQRVP